MTQVRLIPSLPTDPENSLRILYPDGVEAFLTGVTYQEVDIIKVSTGEPLQVTFSYDYTALENTNDNN